MGNGTVRDDGRYWAFISYSHKDAAFGRRLHRRLEAYALPRRLIGRAGEGSVVPRRLTPIFRDREEFPAAQDLSAEVRAALKESRSLIVVCSPAAAASPWVAREVELFREMHPGRPVFAAIREGDPKDSLPPVLRLIGPDGRAIEPLAADFRRGHDGWELGLLKLIAGLLGVGLDELVQRDNQRRLQRVMAVTATAVAAMLVMSVLTAIALSARSEAERQRGEAQDLAKFMHTDLRAELRGLGRIDLLTAVNARALDYYDNKAGEMTPDLLAQRAHVLQAIGEDDESRGDNAAALKRFHEAFAITAAQLGIDPNNAERVFDHAQSVYWIGFAAYVQGKLAQVKPDFEEYRRLSERMIALAPSEPRYIRELAFAEGDLCSLAVPKDPATALHWCTRALEHMQAAVGRMPKSSVLEADLFNRQHWLADAYHLSGDDVQAKVHRLIAEKMINELVKAEPMNMDYKTDWIALQRNLARGEVRAGQAEEARARLIRARTVIEQMTVFDPSNTDWNQYLHWIEDDLAHIQATPTQGR